MASWSSPRETSEGLFLPVRAATEDDLRAIVTIHTDTFPEFFLTSLGPRFLEAFYRGLLDSTLGTLLVAERDREVRGFVGGTTDEQEFFYWLKTSRRQHFLRASLRAMIDNPRSIRRLWRARNRHSESLSSTVPAALLSIGVEPGQKGSGVGHALFQAFALDLADKGSTEFRLTTDAMHNDAVIRFYESHGMQLGREYETPEGRAMREYIFLGQKRWSP